MLFTPLYLLTVKNVPLFTSKVYSGELPSDFV